eukprot:scpid93222/ scgid20638/ 
MYIGGQLEAITEQSQADASTSMLDHAVIVKLFRINQVQSLCGHHAQTTLHNANRRRQDEDQQDTDDHAAPGRDLLQAEDEQGQSTEQGKNQHSAEEADRGRSNAF